MAGDMRIVVHGQAAFGKSMLDALLERGENVVAAYCPPTKEGARKDPVQEAAEAKGIPVIAPQSFKKPEVWDEFKGLKPDLQVMAFVTKFVPEDFLYIPTQGSIQYHPSLLPLHRGPSSINWPIIWGEKKTGLSIFWPDNGLDTGPLLLQKAVEIGPDDTLGSIYFDKLYPMGIEAMLESIDLVRAGKAPKTVQDESRATYEGWCKAENVQLDWSKPVADVYNMIRGANPQPGAWSTLNGKTVQIFDAARVDGSGAPGEVIDITDDAVIIAAQGGAIAARRLRPEGAGKIGAGDFVTATSLTKGAKFGS